jgi:hypothetical protein
MIGPQKGETMIRETLIWLDAAPVLGFLLFLMGMWASAHVGLVLLERIWANHKPKTKLRANKWRES